MVVMELRDRISLLIRDSDTGPTDNNLCINELERKDKIMSNWRDTIKEVSVWYKTLDGEQKAEAAKLIKQSLFPDFTLSDEYTDQTFEHARVQLSDLFENLTGELKRDIIWRAKRSEAKVLELLPEVDRLRKLVGESDDFEWSVCLEYLVAFVKSAKAREEYVDVINLVYSRLQSEWEVKDYYDHEDIARYSGADIRAMLIDREHCAPEVIHIDDEKMYKVPFSPGGGTTLSNLASHVNAYYYKGKCHEAGVESVAITNLGTIIGVEERIQTAGDAGIVARYLRTYRADPEDLLPREWNNSKIWPATRDYTEIRF